MLSAVIITYNEESNIAECIASVKPVADEILVLDSFSTDRTEAICREKGVRFEQHAFDGHIQQKNRARLMATHEWVLSLDADERPDAGLIQSILKEKAAGFAGADGYTMNRLHPYCGRPVKTCGWYPDTKLRLWKKTAGEWRGINPHDRFELFEGGKAKHLSGDLIHYTYRSHEAMVRQADKFAQIGAQQYKDRSVFWLLGKMLLSGPFKFIRNYLFKAGMTDGLTGFYICYHQAREVVKKYAGALRLKITGS